MKFRSLLASAAILLALAGGTDLIAQNIQPDPAKRNLAHVATAKTSSQYGPAMAIPNYARNNRKPAPDSKETYNSAVWIKKE